LKVGPYKPNAGEAEEVEEAGEAEEAGEVSRHAGVSSYAEVFSLAGISCPLEGGLQACPLVGTGGKL